MARRSLKYLLNRYTLSFRNRIVVIAVGMVICLLSLVYTNRMAHDLREKEQHAVEAVTYKPLTLPTSELM